MGFSGVERSVTRLASRRGANHSIGKWQESNYKIDNPRPQRRKPAPEPFLEPPSFADCATSTQRDGQSSRRTGLSETITSSGLLQGDDLAEVVSVKRPTQPDATKAALERQLWSDILGSTHASAQRTSQTKGKQRASGDETEDEKELPEGELPPRPSDHSVVAAGSTFLSRMSSSRVSAFSTPPVPAPANPPPLSSAAIKQRQPSAVGPSSGFLSGVRIQLVGRAYVQTCVDRILEYGGTPVARTPETVDFDEAEFVIILLHE